ncbi:MAG: 2-dehydropantoate 2-reductase [Clostridia bacterium]|nr:2-dehydropantoate 2-reductase [Clostridia bacterium]
MRAAIYGAGAMGTILGAYIAKAGKQIDLISRNQAHVAALKGQGARIVGTVNFIQPVNALLPSEMTGKYDLVFLQTKQRYNSEIIAFLRNFLAENGVICTLQNGLPEAVISEIIGADNTYGCAVAWGATFHGEGESELTSNPNALTFSLGCYGKADERLNIIREYLESMGKVAVEENLIGARWTKLSINAAFSGLSALTGLKFGEISKHKTGKRVALEVINESIRVANAAGIVPAKIQGRDVIKLLGYKTPLKKAFALFLLPIAMKNHAKLESGMLHALRRGERCEIDYIDGVVCSFGKKYGVNTPVCDAICALVHEIEDGKREITEKNLNEFTAFI